MKHVLFILAFLFVSCADAGLPPTTSRKSGDASNFTTFNFQFPNFTGTRTGSTTVFSNVSVAGGGTGLGTLTANNVILGNGTSSPTFVAPSTSGNVLTSNGTTWTSAAPTAPTRCFALYSDQKAAGTNGGTSFTIFTQRNLTTENYDNCNVGTLTSNQIVLIAGTYRINACAPAYNAGWHQIRLRNATAATTVIYGSSAYADNANEVETTSCLDFVFTANGTDAYDIQHVVTNAVASNGLGIRDAAGVGGGERFAIINLEKL